MSHRRDELTRDPSLADPRALLITSRVMTRCDTRRSAMWVASSFLGRLAAWRPWKLDISPRGNGLSAREEIGPPQANARAVGGPPITFRTPKAVPVAEWRRSHRRRALQEVARRARGLRWSKDLLSLLLEELYVDDSIDEIIGNPL